MTYGAFFDKNKIDTELKELETQMQDANFWNDQNNAKRITQQVSFLKDELDNYHNLNTIIDELDTFEQILQEEWS
ncbi:MAG: PCRF domain-containing protein, partial [Candidatus Cloacimonetes bacterium]|nr:PCRF domain-containing protein [Candidatus Cloacimonadota bacterium]